jgi:hypothetical protein
LRWQGAYYYASNKDLFEKFKTSLKKDFAKVNTNIGLGLSDELLLPL